MIATRAVHMLGAEKRNKAITYTIPLFLSLSLLPALSCLHSIFVPQSKKMQRKPVVSMHTKSVKTTIFSSHMHHSPFPLHGQKVGTVRGADGAHCVEEVGRVEQEAARPRVCSGGGARCGAISPASVVAVCAAACIKASAMLLLVRIAILAEMVVINFSLSLRFEELRASTLLLLVL